MYAIIFEFDDDTRISCLEHEVDWPEGLECGIWKEPFPNEKGNSTALGLIELFAQSDSFGQVFRSRVAKRVVVQKVDM